MNAWTAWLRARLLGLLLMSHDDDLVPGTAYVWLVPGSEQRLAVGELLSLEAWVEPAHLPGDAVAQAFRYAVIEDPSGHRRTVPRAEVLWPLADHTSIQASARALSLPVVPTSLRGRPSWRLGGVRLGVTDMVELGRLVAVP